MAKQRVVDDIIIIIIIACVAHLPPRPGTNISMTYRSTIASVLAACAGPGLYGTHFRQAAEKRAVASAEVKK